MIVAGNVWLGGYAPIGVALHVDQAENGDVAGGRIEGLTPEQLSSFDECAERKLHLDGRTYEVRVATDGTFIATGRVN